jgi:hypothetical protein
MELVQEAVQHRREHDAHARDERQPAEQRVAPGKNLPRIRLALRHRPHARQNHRRIFKRIQPRQFVEMMIAQNADAQREGNDAKCQRKIPRKYFEIDCARQQRTFAVFNHRTSGMMRRANKISSANTRLARAEISAITRRDVETIIPAAHRVVSRRA